MVVDEVGYKEIGMMVFKKILYENVHLCMGSSTYVREVRRTESRIDVLRS